MSRCVRLPFEVGFVNEAVGRERTVYYLGMIVQKLAEFGFFGAVACTNRVTNCAAVILAFSLVAGRVDTLDKSVGGLNVSATNVHQSDSMLSR